MLLDGLATRYSLLPSEVLKRSDTLDFMVMDAACAYENYQRAQAEARQSGRPVMPNLKVNELQEIMERHKNVNKTGSGSDNT